MDYDAVIVHSCVCLNIYTCNISWCPLSWRSCRLPARRTAILLMWREISVSAAPWPLSLSLSLVPSLTRSLALSASHLSGRKKNKGRGQRSWWAKAPNQNNFSYSPSSNPAYISCIRLNFKLHNNTISNNLQKHHGTFFCVNPLLFCLMQSPDTISNSLPFRYRMPSWSIKPRCCW